MTDRVCTVLEYVPIYTAAHIPSTSLLSAGNKSCIPVIVGIINNRRVINNGCVPGIIDVIVVHVTTCYAPVRYKCPAISRYAEVSFIFYAGCSC